MTTNELIWQRFLRWLPSAPPVGSPLALFQHYRGLLIAA